MKKRLFAIFLCLCMTVTLLPTVTLPVAAVDTVTAYYNGTGLYKYADCTGVPVGTTSHFDITFRRTITNIVFKDGVESIGDNAFYNCSALTSVAIPEGVKSIGDSAFYYCSALTSVAIPEGVTSIGDSTFSVCPKLTNVTIPSSTISIGDAAFRGTALTGVSIPASVTSIGNGAFAYCSALTAITVVTGSESFCSVEGVLFSKDQTTLVAFPVGKSDTSYTIPESVTAIGASAFGGCRAFESMMIPSGVISIGESAFSSCSKMTSVAIPEGVTSIGDSAFESCYALTSVAIPSDVTSIGDSAFEGCYGLISVTIQEGVTSIGGSAFKSCDALTSVTIPASVTSIGDCAFGGCSTLTAIMVDTDSESFCSVDSVLFSKDQTTLAAFPAGKSDTSYMIPEIVTAISASAFYKCTALESVTIPTSVTSIGDRAFYNCTALKSVAIPTGVTVIGEGMFNYCTALKNVAIPKGVTSIGDSAFHYCTALISVAIPEGVTAIGKGTFSGCTALISVAIPEGVMAIGEDSFRSCTALTSMTIPSSVEFISPGAFMECTKMTSVTIKEGVKSIGDYAFARCIAMTSMVIPASVESIGEFTFADSSALSEIQVDAASSSFCSIDGILFSKDKTMLVAYPVGKSDAVYMIPDSVLSIGKTAFLSCTDLTCVIIPSGITTIDDYAFTLCTSLANAVFLGETPPTTIGNNVFDYCSSGFAIWVPDSSAVGSYKEVNNLSSYSINAVTEINEDELFILGSLRYKVTSKDSKTAEVIGNDGVDGNIVIPEMVICKGNILSVTAIGEYSFSSCAKLTSVTIPSSVEIISPSAFMGCINMTSVTIKDGVKSIGDYAFMCCTALTSVSIPESVESIGNGVFAECTSLTAFNVDTASGNFCTVGGILFSKDITTLVAYPACKSDTSYTIPDTVTTLIESAFDSCTALTSITIPTSVTSIGNYAFYQCAIADVVIPEGVTAIGEGTFEDCTALTSVTIPTSVESIGDSAFAYCTALTSMTIPEGVMAIGESAFDSCTALTSVTIPTSVTSIGNYAFCQCAIEDVVIPEGVTAIGEGTFEDCTALTSVTIPTSVESIGDYAFYSCTALTNAVFSGETPPTVGSEIFDGCDDNFTIWVPSSAVTSYETVFSGSGYLISAITAVNDNDNFSSGDLKYTVTSAEKKTAAVTGYNEVDGNIAIPEMVICNGNSLSVTSIGNNAFADCNGLAGITIPDSITTIGSDAFSDCINLTDVVLKGKVTSVGANAFNAGETTIIFVVPDGTINYYKGLLTSDVMGSTTAVIAGTKFISAIMDLPAAKNVAYGTAQNDLSLPDTLTVTADGVQETVNVTWTSSPKYSAFTARTYIFTPVLPDVYVLNDGVSAVVKVTVAAAGGGGDEPTSGIVTVPVTGGFGTIGFSVSVSGSTANIKATDAQLKEIVSNTETGIIKIDVSGLKVDEVVIPSNIVKAVVGVPGSTGLEVALPTGTVTLDKTALDFVAGKGDIKLSVETVSSSALTDTQKEILGTQAETALVVDVNLYAGGTKTSTFGDGKISVSVLYTLKSGERADNITVWFIKDDGTIEPKNGVYNAATGCVEFITEHLSQYLIVNFPFADVTEGIWYYNSVAYAYNNGLFVGTSDTAFSPNAAMTRQMIWMVLARMDGKAPTNMDAARTWAMENGISDGTNPTNSITREQMATTLYRYAQYKGYGTKQGGMAIREFEDYDSISVYALTALEWAANTGLMQGNNNIIMPADSATRAQVATILQRFCQIVAK